jgi:predicted GIY-YIG superfamily endonuclease
MKPEEILSLPIRERRNVIDSFDDRLGFLSKLKENYELPPDLETLHEILEEERYRQLPNLERQEEFKKLKEKWCECYPDFKRISDLMLNFKTNELLIEYTRKSPPESIQEKAIEIYKKCLSFRAKLTNRQIKSLVYHSTTGPYSIDKEIVNNFVSEYKTWVRKLYDLWNDIYYLKEDFFKDAGYKSNWKFYIKYPSSLAEKVTYVQNDINLIVDLLNSGKTLLELNDQIITEEYKQNSIEMSLYERELEISRMTELKNENDEQYCYVYTLECELFVFYVGIASSPKERFEQHLRGAFSNESHLFKSKFILKYYNQIKQNIVYEGTRRECKLFEKQYIAEHQPLGNMTEGGEG